MNILTKWKLIVKEKNSWDCTFKPQMITCFCVVPAIGTWEAEEQEQQSTFVIHQKASASTSSLREASRSENWKLTLVTSTDTKSWGLIVTPCTSRLIVISNSSYGMICTMFKCFLAIVIHTSFKYNKVFNRPGVAGAVLLSPPSLIH